jgi:hypothetical protein
MRRNTLFKLGLLLALGIGISWASVSLDISETVPKDVDNINTTQPAGLAQDAMPRNQLLYENHCTGCHESMVHIRKRNKARSLNDIRYWVARWATQLRLDWSQHDIDSVTEYLNRRFYHYNHDDTAPR